MEKHSLNQNAFGNVASRANHAPTAESESYESLEAALKVHSAPPRRSNVDSLQSFNKFGMCYFASLTFVMYATILCLAGKAYADSELHLKLGSTYLVVNILANFYLCRNSAPFYTTRDAIDLPGPSSAFCPHCQISQPPKCHHCPICRRCVPKRDHHCFFTGVCVGERNQGFFAVYCLHCGLGLLLGFAVLSAHLSSVYYEVFSWDFYRYFPPVTVLDLLLGNIDVVTFMSILLLAGGLVSGVFSLGLFAWQSLLICFDMTSYDALLWWQNRASLPRFRPFFNVRKNFGSFWMIQFFLPISICLEQRRRQKQYL